MSHRLKPEGHLGLLARAAFEGRLGTFKHFPSRDREEAILQRAVFRNVPGDAS
jgi:hypothetical protein